jgi:N-acetylglucosaminyldiphosphoundecaprenol N-acetyl-beta-D-mannosaminyltransferase
MNSSAAIHNRNDLSQILGVNVSILTIPQLHTLLAAKIHNQQKALILNVNVHCLNLAYEQKWLRSFLNSADVVFCDGAGVMLAARLLGQQIPQRITYADWIWQLAEFAEPRGHTFFFLGARPGIAEKAATQLLKKHPGLKILGIWHGYFDKQTDGSENQAIIQEINRLQPHILVLGFGMPLQERWLYENWSRLNVNIALTGGAVFDYVSGELNRAPRWMTNNGFEWMGRLLIEPRRLWRRYLVGNPLFLWRVLKQRFDLLGL